MVVVLVVVFFSLLYAAYQSKTNNEIEEKDNKISELEDKIVDLGDELIEKDDKIEEKDDKIREIEEKFLDLLREKDWEIEEKNDKIDELEYKIKDIKKHSWLVALDDDDSDGSVQQKTIEEEDFSTDLEIQFRPNVLIIITSYSTEPFAYCFSKYEWKIKDKQIYVKMIDSFTTLREYEMEENYDIKQGIVQEASIIERLSDVCSKDSIEDKILNFKKEIEWVDSSLVFDIRIHLFIMENMEKSGFFSKDEVKEFLMNYKIKNGHQK